MTTLYNCRTDGDQFRITKFDTDYNVESSYLCTETECECSAGARPSCRHRIMLPRFQFRNAVNSNWFYDYDRNGWVQIDLREVLELAQDEGKPNFIYSEDDCPGHVASEADAKVCGRCGVHIDSLRPPVELAQDTDDVDWDTLAEERMDQRPRINRRGF